MMPSPLLYGHRAIAAHLGIRPRELAHPDRHRLVPTYRERGRVCASAPALDHYRQTKEARHGEPR